MGLNDVIKISKSVDFNRRYTIIVVGRTYLMITMKYQKAKMRRNIYISWPFHKIIANGKCKVDNHPYKLCIFLIPLTDVWGGGGVASTFSFPCMSEG